MAKVLRTSTTPNPNALKFHMDCRVTAEGSRSFPDKASAQQEPLARALFEIPQVTSVLCFEDVVTINKTEDSAWDSLIPAMGSVLEQNLVSRVEAQSRSADESTGTSGGNGSYLELDDDAKLQKVDSVLNADVRPMLAGDGGGVTVMEVKDEMVQIHYEGACGGCPSATMGTLRFIQQVLRQKVHPEITVVAG
jgi:Fe-S cluster biogenesis protein NfuA